MRNNERSTKAKQAIEQLFEQTEGALSAAEIIALMENNCNRVTIYRILDKMLEKEMIHKVIDYDGVTKYASCQTTCTVQHNHNHVHFSCTSCNTLSCINDLKPSFQLPKNYVITNMNITLSGLCAKCS